MEACWAQDAAERPSFEVIARRIKAMQQWRKVISKMRHVVHSDMHPTAPGNRSGLVGAAQAPLYGVELYAVEPE